MATTRLADLVYGPLFLPTTIQRIAETSTLRQSGIAAGDDQIAEFANGPGNIVEMPFWNDLAGDSNVSTDDPAQNATPNKLTMGEDRARKIRRNNGWQVANLVASIMAEDPLDRVAQLIANYWDREEQKVLMATMKGVFADPLMAGNFLDVGTEDGNGASAVMFGADVAAEAYSLLGEYGGTLTGVMMHSRIKWNLHAARALEYNRDPVTGLEFATWDGKRVIVNDNCPRTAGTTSGYKYISYLFGQGAIGYAEATGAGGPKKPVELDSVAGAGNGEGIETMWYRRHWVMHPRGVAFDATPVGESPTNAELSAGTSWTRKYDPRLIRMVAVETNG